MWVASSARCASVAERLKGREGGEGGLGGEGSGGGGGVESGRGSDRAMIPEGGRAVHGTPCGCGDNAAPLGL